MPEKKSQQTPCLQKIPVKSTGLKIRHKGFLCQIQKNPLFAPSFFKGGAYLPHLLTPGLFLNLLKECLSGKTTPESGVIL
jgi:hypothetical protein